MLALFGGEVEALAGFEGEGDIEVGLDVIESVAFHCETLLQFDDLRAGGDIGVVEIGVEFSKSSLDVEQISFEGILD